jgi:hypothetical protein
VHHVLSIGRQPARGKQVFGVPTCNTGDLSGYQHYRGEGQVVAISRRCWSSEEFQARANKVGNKVLQEVQA